MKKEFVTNSTMIIFTLAPAEYQTPDGEPVTITEQTEVFLDEILWPNDDMAAEGATPTAIVVTPEGIHLWIDPEQDAEPIPAEHPWRQVSPL